MQGTLYLVATPIGNLQDITLRALSVLKEVDLIACEDTRHTRNLLNHYGISKPTVSYHEHNEGDRTPELIGKLASGSNVALVTDAGTPLISDPGYRLVSESIANGITVTPIPGPSALVAAISASGLPVSSFTFCGFLPSKRGARRARLREFANCESTLIFYETPHRIRAALADATETLGDREAVLAREMTKLHEEFLRGSLSELADKVTETARGEMVLLIGPAVADNAIRHVQGSISEEVDRLMSEKGLDRKSALKRVARARALTRSEAYRLLAEERSSRSSRE